MQSLLVTISIAAAALGLLFFTLTRILSGAPGLSAYRHFGWSCMCGALYATTNAVMALPVAMETGMFATRVGMALAHLHAASWVRYAAAHEARPPSRFERVQIGALVGFATLCVIPGVAVREPWLHELPRLGAVYRDGHVTTFGSLGMVLLFGVVLRLFGRALLRARGGLPTDRAEVIGLGCLLVAGTHDGLVSNALVPTPYLLDLGYLVLVVGMALALTKHFVDRSAALEASSQKLARTQEELVARERLVALGEMSAVIAHEVRNPLGVIFNAVASLKRRGATNDDQRELLRIVEEEAERLKRMVSDLLHFAQPRRLATTEVDAEGLVASAADAARASLGVADDAIVIVAQGPSALRCDDGLVRQAMVNLLTNALQAPGRRGPVKVDIHAQPSAVEIRVADDGDGIPPEHRADVFRPFFTTRASGTGLGLAVVRKIVEAHGGSVVLADTPGGGATFVVRLEGGPTAREEAA